ncbi:hypothetical protein EDB19DRAFT_1915939 [Suillus lakei]|nr:hypothetical protein EDB19DRAFT_1915939 [Suillus lakei]
MRFQTPPGLPRLNIALKSGIVLSKRSYTGSIDQISALVEMCDLAQGAPNLYYNSLLFIVSLGQKTGILTPIVSYSVPQWVGGTLPQVDLGKDKSTPSSISSNVQTTTSTTSTTPTTTSMTSMATIVPTMYDYVHHPYNGSIITITTSAPTPSPANNTSNTGAIIGDIVGGIVVIAFLGLLFFCLRCLRRRDEFDGNFDSDHIVSHPSGGGILPQVDPGEDNEITPYHDRGGSMRQYVESPFLAGAGVA